MFELYQFEECPFCVKVRAKLTELGIDFICRQAPHHLPEKRKRVIEIGGKNQVPLLVDKENNVVMYESDDIIEYLEKRFGKR